MRTAAALIASAMLGACTAPRPLTVGAGRLGVRLDVPFYPDDGDQCGPSVLASVLGYWNRPAEPEDLRSEIYRPDLKGALTVDMLLAAQARGLQARIGEGGLSEVKAELDAGRPVIAFVDTGYFFYPIGHYLVITGYDEGRDLLLVHSGLKRDEPMSYARFDKSWSRKKRWALLTRPLQS